MTLPSRPDNMEENFSSQAHLNSNDCIAILDSNLIIITADSKFVSLFGRTRTESRRVSFYDLMHPDVIRILNRQFTQLSSGYRARFTEQIIGIPDTGESFTGDLTGILLCHGDDSQLFFVIIVRPDKSGSAAPPTGAPIRQKPVLSYLDARVLEGIASGASTAELATRLYLSRQGVEYHVGVMLRRFKVTNRAALIARAYSMGILTLGRWPPSIIADSLMKVRKTRSRAPVSSNPPGIARVW